MIFFVDIFEKMLQKRDRQPKIL